MSLPADESHSRLLPYDPEWGRLYERESLLLREVFGRGLLDIAHIGSTAVPGLHSKPIIDIAVLIPSKTSADKFVEPLAEIGYEFDSSSSERHFFRKGQPTRFHLSIGYADFARYFQRQVAFRDYLRRNTRARDDYAVLKSALLQRDPAGTGEYIHGKSEFVLRTLKAAGFEG